MAPSFYEVLTVIAISMLFGIFIGAWLLTKSINWLIDKGTIDFFYRGARRDHFRLW